MSPQAAGAWLGEMDHWEDGPGSYEYTHFLPYLCNLFCSDPDVRKQPQDAAPCCPTMIPSDMSHTKPVLYVASWQALGHRERKAAN